MNNQMPEVKVSIIIPCYNAENVIEHCLNSILRQTFRDFEIIAIDDGSIDNTLKILKGFQMKDNRVVVVHKNNGGQMMARRDGYRIAKGGYIMFVDNDDYLPPKSVQTLYEFAVDTAVDCVVGNHDRVFSDCPLLKRPYPQSLPYNRIINKVDIWDLCYGQRLGVDDNLIGTMWARLYKKTIIDQAFRDDPDRLFPNCLLEDWWFTLVFLNQANSLYVTNKVVYHYRYGGSSSKDFPGLENSNKYFDYRYDFFKQKGDAFIVRTYVCFVHTFYWFFGGKIRSKKYSQGELLSFITTNINNLELLSWAREHKDIIPADIKDMSDPILSDSPEAVLHFALKQNEKGKLRRLVKNILT